MRLVDHGEFDQWVTAAAAARTSLPEAFIEKDYWITEVLRALAIGLPGAIVFKGGTSLSKGWHMLSRFSEDLDILVRPGAVNPPWTTAAAMERGLKNVCSIVEQVDGLTGDPSRTTRSRPKGRAEFFRYVPRFSDFPGIEPGLVVEPGIGSGDWPTSPRQISSLAADTVVEAGAAEAVGADDLVAFEIETLEPARTFVEKLFIAHAAVERHRAGEGIGRRARHFADLAILTEVPSITDLVRSDRYGEIVRDVDRASREWYGAAHNPPPDLRFAQSSVFIPDDVFDAISRVYDAECSRLFFGKAYPSLSDGQDRLRRLRDYL